MGIGKTVAFFALEAQVLKDHDPSCMFSKHPQAVSGLTVYLL
jgi:hypothetical protein